LLAACLIAYFTYVIVWKSERQVVVPPRIALWMVVGMWSLGLWFHLLQFTLVGDGIRTMDGSAWIDFLLFSLAPFPSLLLYGWDGSFHALVLLTIILFRADTLEKRYRAALNKS
jgi:hypothetical protein